MDIFSTFMLTSIILAIALLSENTTEEKTKRRKIIFCFLSGLFLFLIGGLKSTSVGVDSERYSETFYYLQRYDVSDVFNIFNEEWGFYYLIRILSFVSLDHQIMFATVSAIFAFSLSFFIYKHSKDLMVSFIMTITMSYFAFSLSGLRQTVAIAILLFSFDFIIKRKPFFFIGVVAFASLFHVSSVLFLPAYFLVSKEVSYKRVIVYFAVAPIVFLLRPLMIEIIQLFLYSEYEIDPYQSSGGWTTLYIYILILVVALIFKKQLQSQNKDFPFYFSMMYVGMLLQMFVPIQPNIFRVSMYFNISSLILIAGIIHTQKNFVSKMIAYSIFLILMGIKYYIFSFYAAEVNPYTFFWE